MGGGWGEWAWGGRRVAPVRPSSSPKGRVAAPTSHPCFHRSRPALFVSESERRAYVRWSWTSGCPLRRGSLPGWQRVESYDRPKSKI